jgi:hypothetical protein
MKVLVAKNSDGVLGFTALGCVASELMVAIANSRARPSTLCDVERRDLDSSNDVRGIESAAQHRNSASLSHSGRGGGVHRVAFGVSIRSFSSEREQLHNSPQDLATMIARKFSLPGSAPFVGNPRG